MASFLGTPIGASTRASTPGKKSSAPSVATEPSKVDWNAELSDGDESTYTYRVPDTDDAASQASTHASEWVK
eukprot:830818-Alexandrium_andersonii.AAC.1